MKKCISNFLVKKLAGVILELDDTSEEENQQDQTPSKKDKEQISPTRKALPDEISSEIRTTQRPNIKPPRRVSDYKAKWKGEGSRQTRNEYQKEYRREHGNDYAKKINTASFVVKVKNKYGADRTIRIENHEIRRENYDG